MVLSVIIRSTSAIAKLSAITKTHKYRRFHERAPFYSNGHEVHDTPKHDMNQFFKECTHPLHNR
jgi:hypothetical protein